MKTLSFALAIAIFPFAAQAGEALTYVVDGETFEGYRSAANSRLGRSYRIRDEAGRHVGRYGL